MGSVLVRFRSPGVSLVLDVPCQQTNLGPDLNEVTVASISVDASIVHEGEVTVKRDDGLVRISSIDRDDSLLLSLILVEVCRGDDDIFVLLPVHCFLQNDLVLASRGCGLELSPRWSSFNAMDVDRAVAYTNAFIAVDGHGGVVLLAIHGDGQLGSVRLVFSSGLKVAMVDKDVMGIKCSLVVFVSIRREDD